MEKKWYVIHTYSGYENKVKTNIEKKIESMGMEDKIFQILVPLEEEEEIKDGKKKVSKKKIFPGYVLLEMIMTDDSWYVIRNTAGVTGFVGSGSKPIPLKDSEVESILKQMGLDEARIKVDFEVGEKVKLINCPFEDFVAEIQDIYPEKARVKVLVSMSGRDIPTELDFTQIEKI